MVDERLKKLAYNLVNNSVKVQKGDNVLIEGAFSDAPLVHECIREVFNAGGYPYYNFTDNTTKRAMMMNTSPEHMATWVKHDRARMEDMQCYIGIRGGGNSFDLSDVPSENMTLYNSQYFHKVHHEVRISDTRWVVLRYPTSSFAQSAGMSTEQFEDFYFNVCNLDYSKMGKAMEALVELMEKTDKVRILDGKTDLSFSIMGIPAIPCAGNMNIPDGEVYTAPVKDSVNGYISYSAPSVYNGIKHDNVRLEFKDGRIIKATSSNQKAIDDVFNTDEGARYVGEFAIGVNPYVTKPMLDILFDEKISGSIHFTPGASYDDAPNGNSSAIHWDLVHIQTKEWGGGEIYFDGRLIRKDGRFVVPELFCLNPENLI